MPPKKKFSKEQIIDKAFEIAKTEGIEAITARSVSKKLKCSVAPIYVNFKDIEELKQAVVGKIFKLARKLAQKTYTGDRFLDIGIASLKFAKQYSVLFRELVLQKNPYMDDYDQELGNDIIGEIIQEKEFSQFSEEEVGTIFLKMRIFQLGLSAMVANDLLPEDFDEVKQIELLKSAGEDVIQSTRFKKIQQ
ncbi:MAG: TetR/AcrR family transcriptional regulator [Thermotogota bacterium]